MTYEIGGVTYHQRPLVLGQIKQLLEAVQGLTFAGDDLVGLIATLGERLPHCLAIVLTPEGVSLKDKNRTALAETLEYEADLATVMQVVDDFFGCNPIASLVERLSGTMGLMQRSLPESGLTSSPSSSPAATSPAET